MRLRSLETNIQKDNIALDMNTSIFLTDIL